MAATIKDIAKRTGLGLATISSYINGGNVREKNKVKIELAIDELHYEINEVARGLKTNRTRSIGVLIPELSNLFCTEIITGIEDILRKHEYATIVCDCRTDQRLEQQAAEFLYRKRVDGIINMPVDPKGRHLRLFQESAKPVVLIDRRIQEPYCDSVYVDNRAAARDAVMHLVEYGHRVIGILNGPDYIFTAQERLQGYRDALAESGISCKKSLLYYGDYEIGGGVQGLLHLMRENPDMTAVFVTNYEMTMGAVIAANEQGIRMPEELSVVGFDNLAFARACSPKLTIVTQPTKEIAEQAAGIMLERLEGDTAADQPTEYITRKLKTSISMGQSVKRV